MTSLERAIRAGCDGLHPTQREQFPCHFPDCQRGDCDVPQIVWAALAAALADDKATIRAMTRAAFDSHTDGKMWPFILTDVLAALRRHILGETS